MSTLLYDNRTKISVETDLVGPALDLYLRENPDVVRVGIGTTADKIHYILLNKDNISFKDPRTADLIYNPFLKRLGIGSFNPEATLDVVGDIKFNGNFSNSGINSFFGPARFYNSVLFDRLEVGIATITKKLDVGFGGTVLTAIASTSNLLGVATAYYGNIGIGSTLPQQKLDIAGSIKIDENIYDSINTPGIVGSFLSNDINGIRWVEVNPLDAKGILVYNDLTAIGIGQSFFGINLLTGDGLGITTDSVQAFVNPINSNIADIRVYDYWAPLPGGNIYRNSNVGINNQNPLFSLDITGTANITEILNVGSNLDVGGTLTVDLNTTLNDDLTVEGASVFNDTVELNSSLIDINNSTATGKFDYRLSSVGTGVSWRPAGVETQNTIWVTKDGNDSNTGLLEGDAKATVGAAAAVAEAGDTIVVRPGVYTENNPIGLRTDVAVTGQDLRLVTIRPTNVTKDVFHVRRGCLIENINFAGSSVSIAHTGCAAVAFPPTNPTDYANTGFIAAGPANEGSTGRWRSPYIRNCTNFMTKSIGMKIDGNHATASTLGGDLKSMVCDSFTQYNENGIGVSITNNGYAQLVSIFTINSDIGIYVDSGGSCDLTNSNSSFGNYGLYAVGIGSTEFTGNVGTYPPTRTEPGVDAVSDTVTFTGISNSRRPYDGQALFFKINLNNYPDAVGSGVITNPMVEIQEIRVSDGGTGFSAASPPTVIIRDSGDLSQQPKGPQGIIAELSPTINEVTGAITAIDVVNSGRNYLSTQNLEVFIDGGAAVGAAATVITKPILFTVDSATSNSSGISTVTFNEFIPYALFGGEQVSFKRISRILTSSHSFEYIGSGVDINSSTPFQGGVPIKANEIVALGGAQIPFTSTDQKGNFDIGEGFQINQPSATIRGRDFSKAIQAEVTPLILALR